ncbi:MAG: glycosyltransferase family 4 protein [Patescibacteria group bacterium]|nr:glycosyltransferase family 4 protein [Patescibacteria group bacterium]
MDSAKKIIYLGNHTKKTLADIENKRIPSNGIYGLDKIAKSSDFDLEIVNFNEIHSGKAKYFRSIIELFYSKQIVFSTQLVNELLLRKIFVDAKAKWLHYNLNLSYVLNKNKNNFAKKSLIINKLKNTDLIACLTESQKELLMQYGLPEKKLVVVHFGVDNEFYQKSEKDKGYIFSVGRDMGRDYQTLIEFAKNIKEKLIILAAPRNMENIKDIPENVEVHFNLSYLKMREFYESAKMIIIPSKREDYIGSEPISDCSGQTVVLEAMACGKPVITSERSWLHDYGLADSIAIYKAEDADDLLAKYNLLINNREKQNELSLKARKIIDEKYNTAKMVDGFKQLFKNI